MALIDLSEEDIERSDSSAKIIKGKALVMAEYLVDQVSKRVIEKGEDMPIQEHLNIIKTFTAVAKDTDSIEKSDRGVSTGNEAPLLIMNIQGRDAIEVAGSGSTVDLEVILDETGLEFDEHWGL